MAKQELSQRDAVVRQIHSFIEAIEAPGIDDVLGCFSEHCIMTMPETKSVLEGQGSIRAHFRKLAPQLRLSSPLRQELISIDVHNEEWALVRAVLRAEQGGAPVALLTICLNQKMSVWRISHVVWQSADERRAA